MLFHLSDQGSFTPIGVHGTPKKTTFPLEFCNEICTIAPYVCAKKITILEKKKLKVVPFQNGGQITIFISHHFDFGQNLKTTFPKEFFIEIWLKIGEHE